MQIPVVIFHVGGNQPYFVNCVNVSSQTNVVYLVGDDSNQHTFKNNSNIKFFHINDLYSPEAEKFKQCFINYSTNNSNYEMYCFLRVFYLKMLFEKTQNTWMFHTDSDCVILENVNDIFSHPYHTSYSIQNVENKYHMVGSIHNSLINMDFCNKFIQLCFDVYDNRTKFYLIEEKIKWHRETGMPGGICDMTLYYLLHSERIIDNIIDLNVPFSHNGNGQEVVFDNNISDDYGYNGEHTYEKQNGLKILINQSRVFYFKTNDRRLIKTTSIHFQGGAKRFLEKFSF